MPEIHKVLNTYPVSPVPNDIYAVKKDVGVKIGVATMNIVTPEIVELKKPLTLFGPTSLYYGEVGTFTITNYGTENDYPVQSYDGIVNRTNDTVTFVCSDTGKETATFTVGSRSITIQMKAIRPIPATIEAPVSGSTVNAAGLVLTTVDFDINYAAASDTHLSTDWEIATDPDFTNIVVSSYNDTVNLTTFTP